MVNGDVILLAHNRQHGDNGRSRYPAAERASIRGVYIETVRSRKKGGMK